MICPVCWKVDISSSIQVLSASLLKKTSPAASCSRCSTPLTLAVMRALQSSGDRGVVLRYPSPGRVRAPAQCYTGAGGNRPPGGRTAHQCGEHHVQPMLAGTLWQPRCREYVLSTWAQRQIATRAGCESGLRLTYCWPALVLASLVTRTSNEAILNVCMCAADVCMPGACTLYLTVLSAVVTRRVVFCAATRTGIWSRPGQHNGAFQRLTCVKLANQHRDLCQAMNRPIRSTERYACQSKRCFAEQI